MTSLLDKTCIVLLACNDYESTQLTVANLMERTPPQIPVFFLPNSMADSFDAGQVKEIGTIYSKMFPGRLIYVNWVKPSFPYQAIGDLIYSKQLARFDYICKIDDDVFPITDNWIENLSACFVRHESPDLAYVTGLINNNPWGFAEIVNAMGLEEEYKKLLPQFTITGLNLKGYLKEEKIETPEIGRGGFGTVWHFPHLARWIHQKTTLQPDVYINYTKNLADKEINNQLRYSIGCMLFRKEEWAKVYNGSKNDEKMWHLYSQKNNKKIYSARNVPMVHLFFYNQRLFNKSLLPDVYEVYRKREGGKLPLIWKNALLDKINYMEERMRNLESGKARNQKLALKFKKLQNKLRYYFYRGW